MAGERPTSRQITAPDQVPEGWYGIDFERVPASVAKSLHELKIPGCRLVDNGPKKGGELERDSTTPLHTMTLIRSGSESADAQLEEARSVVKKFLSEHSTAYLRL